MAVNSYNSTDGHPIFLDTDAPDIKVDPTKAAEYAADVGNRIMRANFAALDGYAYERKGLRGLALDTGFEYEHTGSGWVLREARIVGRVKRSSTATTFPSAGYTNVSGNTFWDADAAQGLSAYSNGWTIPVTGRYMVSYEIRSTAAFLSGVTVNYSGASPTLILAASPSAVQGIADATVAAPVKLTAGDVVRPYLLAATGTPSWVQSVGFFAVEWVGVD